MTESYAAERARLLNVPETTRFGALNVGSNYRRCSQCLASTNLTWGVHPLCDRCARKEAA